MKKIFFIIISCSLIFSPALFTINGQGVNDPESGLIKANISESAFSKCIIDSTLAESERINSFTYGFKMGLGLWKMMQLKGTATVGYEEEYSYPVGFSLGVFVQNKLSEQFSVVNELIFQNSITKITIYPGYDGILEQEITMKYLITAILLKYETAWLADTYFYIGPTLGYLVNSEYNSFDEIYLDEHMATITKDLPAFNITIEFGLGNKYDLFSSNIIVEFKAQIGLTKYEYKEIFGRNIGEWKNYGLILLMGFHL